MIVKRIAQECRAHPVKISSCEPERLSGGCADATVDTYPDWLQITFIRRRTLSTRRSSGLVDAVNGTRGKR